MLLLFLIFGIVLSAPVKTREQRITDAVLAPLPNDAIDWNAAEPELPSHKLTKRALHQNNRTDLIKVTTWAFSIRAWAIISPTFIVGVTIDGSLIISRDSLLTFSTDPQIPKTAGGREVWHNERDINQVIILGNNVNYISTDMATTWTRQENGRSFTRYKFHPTVTGLGIAQSGNELFVTSNFGRTWKSILQSVSQYDWCRAGLGTIPSGRICVISGGYFRYSNDLGSQWVKPLEEIGYFFRVHDRFFTLVGVHNQSYAFFVSADDGSTFHRAVLPRGVNVGPVQRQQFLEDSNGVIWIVVNPERTVLGKSQAGNLYTSDAEGYEFSLVLKDVHTFSGYWDVELITFMEGTLFANKLVGVEVDKPKLRTVITYDNGDNWSPLFHPERDIDGKKYSCDKDSKYPSTCSLHLFGITTWLGVGGDGYFGDLKTDEDAIGLIAGTGNVGSFLSTDKEDIYTYLSRDGGSTWDEIMKGSTVYDFGDFGGLLVLAQNRVPTRKVYFSWNGGETFDFVQLPTRVVIFNILTVSTHSEVFLVLSYEERAGQKIRRIWGLDFNQLHTRNCSATDYEEWIPSNGRQGPNCVLGRNIIYRRRKRDSACYTEEDINKVVNITNCPCQDSDYECDLNFDKTESSGKCAFVGQPEDFITNGCSNNEKTYKISSGYRLIPGDTCVGPLDKYKPATKACPAATEVTDSGHLSTALILMGIVVAVLLALIIGFCFGVRDERVRKMFPWLNQAPSWVTAGYSNTLVVAEMGDEFEEDKLPSDELKSDELSTSLSD